MVQMVQPISMREKSIVLKLCSFCYLPFLYLHVSLLIFTCLCILGLSLSFLFGAQPVAAVLTLLITAGKKEGFEKERVIG